MYCFRGLFVGCWTQEGSYKDTDEQVADIYADPAYATVAAVRNKKIIIASQSYLNCMSHNVVTGMQKLAAEIYGEP